MFCPSHARALCLSCCAALQIRCQEDFAAVLSRWPGKRTAGSNQKKLLSPNPSHFHHARRLQLLPCVVLITYVSYEHAYNTYIICIRICTSLCCCCGVVQGLQFKYDVATNKWSQHACIVKLGSVASYRLPVHRSLSPSLRVAHTESVPARPPFCTLLCLHVCCLW